MLNRVRLFRFDVWANLGFAAILDPELRNHGADALRTFATGYREKKERVPIDLTPPPRESSGRRAGWSGDPTTAKRAKIAARRALAPQQGHMDYEPEFDLRTVL